MNEIDKRVVEMNFENKEFEKNIGTSQKSLEKFKKELNFDETSRGMKKFSHEMNGLDSVFTKMSSNLQKLADKFTGLGNIGEFFLSKIRRRFESMIDSSMRFAKSLTFDQIAAGKEKFESLNKSVRTIMAATGKTEGDVNNVLERLNKYTDWTSYNFADMAQNIGKFTSVGIPLEQAEKHMEGIANWAARSGAGMNEASRAMYNLSQAMGVGKLTLIDWKSIENAGMATKEFKEQMIEAGVAAGTLEATVTKSADGTEKIVYKTSKKLGKQEEVNFQNFSQTLNKGWANTEVLGNTLLGYYYDDLDNTSTERAQELSDDQAKMFNDMFRRYGKIDEKGWKQITDAGLGTDELKQKMLDTGEAYGVLTTEVGEDGEKIYTTVDANGKKIKFTLDTFERGLSGNWLTRNIAKNVYAFDDLAKQSYNAAMQCMSFTDVLAAWKDLVSTGWMASFQHIFGKMSDAMQVFSAICNKVSDSLSGMFGVDGTINRVLSVWENAGGRESLWSMIIGEVDDPNADGKLYEGAYGMIDIIKDISKMIRDAFWDFLKDVASAFYSGDELEDWEENSEFRLQFIGLRIKDFTDRIKGFVGSVRDFFQEIPEGANKSRWEMIKETIHAVFSVISIAAQTIRGVFTFIRKIKKQLEPSFIAIRELILSFAGALIGSEKDLRKSNGIQSFFSSLADSLSPVSDLINTVVVGIADLIRSVIAWEKRTHTISNALSKVGSVIKKVFSFLSAVAKPVINFLKETFSIVGDLIENGFDAESVERAKDRISKAFSTMWTELKTIITPIVEKIKAYFKIVWESIRDSVKAYFDDPNTLGGKIMAPLKKIFGPIWEIIKNIFSQLNDAFFGGSSATMEKGATIGDTIKNFFTFLFDKLKNVNIGKIILAILGGYTVVKLLGMINSIHELFGGLNDLVEKMKNPMKWLLGGDDDDEESFADKAWSLAKSIAVITGAILLIGNMDWVQLGKAVAGLGGVLLLFVGYMGLMKLMKVDDKKMKGFAAFAFSIGLLTISLKTFANISWSQYGKMMAGLGGVLLQLIGFMLITSYMPIGTGQLGGFIKFALSIGIIIFAIRPFAKMSWEQFGKAMAGLGGVLLQLIGFMLITSYMPIGTNQLGGFIKFALSLTILIIALKTFTTTSWESMGKMMAGFAGILLALAGFMLILKKSEVDEDVLKSVSRFSVIISGILYAISPLRSYSWEELAKMLVGFGGIILELGLLMFALSKADVDTKSLGGFLSFVISLWALVKVLTPMADLDWDGVGKMLAVFGGIVLGLTLIMIVASKMKGDEKSIAILLVAAVSIGIMALAFGHAAKNLKGIKWETLAAFTLGLSVTLIAIAGALAIVSKIDIASGMKGIALLAAAIVAIGGALAIALPMIGRGLGGGISNMGEGLSQFSTFIVPFVDTMNSMDVDGLKDKMQVFIDIGKMCGEAGKYSQQISDFAYNFAELTGGLTLFGTAASSVGDTSGALQAIKDILGLKDQMAGFAIGNFPYDIATLGSGIWSFYSVTKEIPDGIDNSGAFKIVEKIAGMTDSLSGLMNISLGILGYRIGSLGSGLSSFQSLTADIPTDENAFPGLGLLEKMANMATGLNTLSTLDLTGIGTKLSDLGGGLSLYASGANAYAEAGKDGEMPDVNKAVELLGEIVATLSGETGELVLPKLPDEQEINGSFAPRLVSLAGALTEFINASNGVNGRTAQGLETIGFLADIQSRLTSDAISAIFILGKEGADNASIGRFGNDIKLLADGLSNFIRASEGVSGRTSKGLEAIGFLAEIQRNFTADAIAAFSVFSTNEITNQTLGQFGTDLVTLSTGLGDFIANSEAYSDKTDKGLAAIGFLADIKSKLTKDNMLKTIVGYFTKQNGLDKDALAVFGSNIGELGVALNTFCTNVQFNSGQEVNFTKALRAVDFLVQLQTELPDVHGIAQFISGQTMSFKELSSGIELLGGSLRKFYNSLVAEGEDGEIYDNQTVLDALKTVTELLKIVRLMYNAEEEMADIVDDGSEWTSDKVYYRAQDYIASLIFLLDDMTSGFEIGDARSGVTRMSSLARALAQFLREFDDVLTDYGDSELFNPDSAAILNNVTASLRNIVATANEAKKFQGLGGGVDFTVVGTAITDGIIAGIKMGQEGVVSAATEVIKAAQDAGLESLGVDTAALDMANFLKNFDESLYIMGDLYNENSPAILRDVASAISYLIDAASKVEEVSWVDLERIMTPLTNLLGLSGETIAPTIAPVLDLTNYNSEGLAEMLNGNSEIMSNYSLALHLNTDQLELLKPIDYRDQINYLASGVSSLENKVSQVSSKLDNLCVVLDSGAVVGGIGSKMDTYLGQNGFYASRGMR